MADSSDFSYLVDRQIYPDRLKRIAFDEFRKAHASERLVAFLGSYPSEFLGYGTWKQLMRAFFRLSEGSSPNGVDVIKQLGALPRSVDRFKDDLVSMDLAELAAGADRRATPRQFSNRRNRFATRFALKGHQQEVEVRPNVVAALADHLGIRRFMTLNYDLEIEWTLLTTEAEKKAAREAKNRRKYWEELHAQEGVLRRGRPTADCLEPRLERYLMGRGRILSDVLERNRSEVLTEFALGTPSKDTRILHLHGRADVPESLIVTKRDYRDLYWEAGFSKLPFEYGMRLIFSGNPILFVGIGSSEPDVMRTLEQFLSDNPNRRAVPAFLLWQSPEGKNAEAVERIQRLELYRRYGIHLLYDRDVARLAGMNDYDARVASPLPSARLRKHQKPLLRPLGAPAAQSARRLEEPIKLLGRFAEQTKGYDRWRAEEFRSPQAKLDRHPQRINMWLGIGGPEAVFTNPARAAHLLAGGSPIKAIVAEPGSGRGALAKAIADALVQHREERPFAQKNRVVLINGSFATETDSIFGILSGAADGLTAQEDGISRAKALKNGLSFDSVASNIGSMTTAADPSKELAQLFGKRRRVTIIVNGMERFVAHDGSALSNELDNLIRLVIGFYKPDSGFAEMWRDLANAAAALDEFDPPLILILIGTSRVCRYLSTLTTDTDYRTIRIGKTGVKSLEPREDSQPKESIAFTSPGSYFEAIRQAFGSKPRLPDPSLGRHAARRFFLGQVLTEEMLQAATAKKGVADINPLLCLEILRTLAFVGQPVEREVLRHVPKIWDYTKSRPQELPSEVAIALEELERLKLILPVEPFVEGGMPRFGLHKSVIAEMRERLGVPLSDARLSGGFNLSLTVVQAIENAAPELAWHDDLGQLVDFLAGAVLDSGPGMANDEVRNILGRRRDPLPADLQWYQPEHLVASASAEFSACLRAALAIMRSYYSVPALLMQANRELDPWMRDGPLSEHADRLERLIRMGRSAATLRSEVRKASPGKNVNDWLGPNPFYPDDLIWLYNELGVVRATQGSLYEAERAFREAQTINDNFVERGDEQQNWRRIQLNLVQVGIDRGDVEGTEERLRDLEAIVETQASAFRAPTDRTGSAWEYIIGRYAGDPRTHPDDTHSLHVRVDPCYPTDLILAVALIQGFRGQCLHLRGALDAAKVCFSDALSILQRLNEQRAYAYFQRQAAALHASLGDRQAARLALKLCIAAAGPARQTDIDHSGRVALVQYDLVESPAQRPPWIMQLTESLRYATSGDMFRLQLECMQCLAQIYLRHGDTDAALRYTNDAMAVAARCGFGLRSVSLRILMAKILAFRGDKASAHALLTSAEQIATKMRYERAVESAENEMIKLA